MKHALTLFIFFIASLTGSHAQIDKKPNDANDALSILNEELSQIEDSLLSAKHLEKKELTEILFDSLTKTRIIYQISAEKHRRNVFDWQHTSGIIIFWVVILIVFVGLFFSGAQFYISLKNNIANDVTGNESVSQKGRLTNVSEFEASLKGIKVKSSVIGIIILVISLAFFYLYLVHIYPIEEIGSSPKKEIETKLTK